MSAVLGYPCRVCRRGSQGITVSIPNEKPAFFCSKKCVGIFMTKKPIKQNEKSSILAGGMAGGAYLDAIGVTDMAKLTRDQWAEFCGKIFQGTCEELERLADDEIPF